MDIHDISKKLAGEFGVAYDEVRKAIDTEAEDMRNDFTMRGGERKPSHQRALAEAYKNVRGWLEDGVQYSVKLDYKELAQFALSHRKACVWAVLTAKARAGKP